MIFHVPLFVNGNKIQKALQNRLMLQVQKELFIVTYSDTSEPRKKKWMPKKLRQNYYCAGK